MILAQYKVKKRHEPNLRVSLYLQNLSNKIHKKEQKKKKDKKDLADKERTKENQKSLRILLF